MKRGLVVAAFLAGLATAGPAAAQESIFGLVGLGTREETGDGRARGLGVLGVALDDPSTAITQNPASLGSLTRMTLSVMGVAGYRTAESRTDQESAGMARFPHQRFALPVFGQAVVSAGFTALTNFRGDFALAPRGTAGFGYQQSFERRGTLYQVPLGVSRAFGSRVRAGVTLDLMLGTVDESWVSSGDSLLALRTRRRDGFSGRTATLGLVVYPLRSLRLGLAASPRHTLSRDARETIEDARVVSNVAVHRDTTTRRDVAFPASLRGGAALQLGPRWLVTSDYLRRDWKTYDGRLYGAASLGLETRVGGGVEFRPGGAGIRGRQSFRAGLSRAVWPQRVGGEPVRETVVHLGAGLDFTGSLGRLDLGLEYARIGNRDDNGFEESTWRILLSVSGQEVWHRRSPR